MNNYDTQEIAKFDRLAGEWWDDRGACAPLHQLNPLRLQFIAQYIDLKNRMVADIGCGGGILSEALAKAGANVTAIDQAESLLQVARQHASAQSLTIDYQCYTAENLAKKSPATFDAVICMEMLEHVPDPAAIVMACATLTKPGGKIFFSTLNRNFKSYLLAILGAEYVLKLLPRGTHDYSRFIQPSELAQWTRANDLISIAMQGLSYQPLTKKYYLTNDISVNYLAAFAK